MFIFYYEDRYINLAKRMHKLNPTGRHVQTKNPYEDRLRSCAAWLIKLLNDNRYIKS